MGDAKVNKRKVTSKDVAKKAGVSQSMVSLVLNNTPNKKIRPETREKVIVAAKELKYNINFNAKSMRTNKAGTVGLLSSWDTASFVYSPIINGLQATLDEKDYGVTICTGKKLNSGMSNEDYIDYYLQNRIDGVIFIAYVGVPYEGIIEKLEKNNIPFVCIIGARDIENVSCLDVDFLQSGYIAANHLATMGYKNVAYIAPHKIENWNYAEKERFEGVKKGASEKNLHITQVIAFNYSLEEEKLIKKAENLLYQNKFDSIVGTSYTCFIFLKAAANLSIKIPNELGIISLDNETYAPYLYPALTTVNEPLYKMAEEGANILLRKIDGEKLLQKLELSPDITVRQSTKKKVF